MVEPFCYILMSIKYSIISECKKSKYLRYGNFKEYIKNYFAKKILNIMIFIGVPGGPL